MQTSTRRSRTLARMRWLWLALSISPAVAAQPVWSVYPGFLWPAEAGMVTADLDGDGRAEIVLSGAVADDVGPGYRRFLAVMQSRTDGGAPRVIGLRRLAAGDAFGGRIVRISQEGVDQVVAAVVRGTASRLVRYTGLQLDPQPGIPAPRHFHLQSVADIDGDGDLDAFGAFDNDFEPRRSMIVSLDTGRPEWSDSRRSWSRAVGQLDDDRALELVLGDRLGAPGRILDGATGALQATDPGGLDGRIVFGNFVGSPATREFALLPRLGPIRIYTLQPELAQLRQYERDLADAVQAIDLDADGLDELVVGEDQFRWLYGLQTSTGDELFRFRNAGSGVFDLAVGQFDADPSLELIYGIRSVSSGVWSNLQVHQLPDGALEMQQSLDFGPHSSVARGDLDGDGRDEALFATRATGGLGDGWTLSVLDAATGERLRSRANVLPEWDSNIGIAIELANLDADPQLEIVVGSRERYEATALVLDGRTLETQWQRTLGGLAWDVEVVQTAEGPAVAIATERVRLLDAISGVERWQTDIFPNTPHTRVNLVSGNLDADPQPEIAVASGATVRILDATSGQVERSIEVGAASLGQRIERGDTRCLHVIVLSTELRRHRCADGSLHSTRLLPMPSTLVAFPADSYGPLVLGDGSRVELNHRGVTWAAADNLGIQVGWGNRAHVVPTDQGVEVLIGSADSVHLLRLDEPLHADGFEAEP